MASRWDENGGIPLAAQHAALPRAGRSEPPAAASLDLYVLAERYSPAEQRFLPEDSPFSTLFADITHRCNMACRNCYIPVRDLPPCHGGGIGCHYLDLTHFSPLVGERVARALARESASAGLPRS